jgi:hypothetical protein
VLEGHGYTSEHTMYVKDLYDIPAGVVKGGGKYANNVCDHFATYFERRVSQYNCFS